MTKDDKKPPHYSPFVVHNNMVYISGQLPVRKGELEPVSASIEEQTKEVLTKLAILLEGAGSDLTNVLRTTIYVADIDLWDKVNSIYAEFFGETKPARTIVPTKKLHFGCLIELDAIAYIEEK